MSVKPLTSRDNPTYKQLLGLAQHSRTRRQNAQTLLDGEHLLDAALRAGCMPRMLVFAETLDADRQDAWMARLPDAAAITLPGRLFAALSAVDSPSGILAPIDIPAARPSQEVGHAAQAVLLEDIQDPGNLGAVLRAAAAAGVRTIHMSRGCTEAWSPKCLRGSQGTQFLLDIHENADLGEIIRHFPGSVYAGLPAAQHSLYELDLTGPAGFLFGNEGAGISDNLRRLCQPFSIPMPGQVESLNVATAAAICLFEQVRQRCFKP